MSFASFFNQFTTIIILFACTSMTKIVHSRSYNTGLIFYDLKSHRPLLPPTISVSRGRALNSEQYSSKGSIWSTFGQPCNCHGSLCGCCAGLKVNQFNFDQILCANVTFSAKKERIFMEVFLDQKSNSRYGISARNPSPLCIPVMMPIPMAMCVQMSDIAIKGNNLNMCMDFVVRLASTDLFEMHFQCMKMGLDGIQYVDKDGKPVIPAGSVKTNDANEYYDDISSSDEKTLGIHDNERDDNVIDNVIEIDDYDEKPYEGQVQIQANDGTIKPASTPELEIVAHEENVEQKVEEEEMDFGDEKLPAESQMEGYDELNDMETTETEFKVTTDEEEIMTTTIIVDNSESSLNEIFTTTLAEIDHLETTTTMPTISNEQVIKTDAPTDSDMLSMPVHTTTTEDPEVKTLIISNHTANVAQEYLHAENLPVLSASNLITASDLKLESKEDTTKLSVQSNAPPVTMKPKASRILSSKRVRKGKSKRKATQNPITLFGRLFDFF